MTVEKLWRWRVALMVSVVGVVAAIMRFGSLGSPTSLVFDEVFYARGGYSLMELGYEGKWEGSNQDFANGDFSQLTSDGDFVVHPNTGKLLIGLGIKIFGPSPFGWRFMAALCGVLACIILAFAARRLFQSTIWGGVAGLLLAVDGEHVVLSRTALLDGFLTFFVVAGFALLVTDRFRNRALLEAAAARERAAGIGVGSTGSTGSSGTVGAMADASGSGGAADAASRLPGAGPDLGIRWWRVAAIVVLSLSVTVKWNGLYFMAAFLVMSVVMDFVDRYQVGYAKWFDAALIRAIPAFLTTIIVLPLTYLASWIPWFTSENSWGRNWATSHPGEGVSWLPDSLRSLVHYHEQMWQFHRGLDTAHNYMSNPWTWPFQVRPTAFYFQDAPDADCGADRCVSAIHAVGDPFVWWVAFAVLLYALWRIIVRRDMLALAVSVGYLAAWLPWLLFAERTIFTFYTVTMAPFVALLLVWAMQRVAQPPRLQGAWRPGGLAIVGAYLGVVLILAGFFAPIWTGEPIPFEYWQMHMWLSSWV